MKKVVAALLSSFTREYPKVNYTTVFRLALISFLFLFIGCIVNHKDFPTIINRQVLEINLKVLWSNGIVNTDEEEINENNLRYSAYRSLNVWLW